MTKAILRHQPTEIPIELAASKNHPNRQNPQRASRHQSSTAIGRFWRDNGLSLVLVSLFLVFLGGQTFSGWFHYNEELEEHQQPRIGFFEYLRTGSFGEAVFENWESEFLQMGLYVLLTAFLFQRGSAESKDPDESDERSAVPLIANTHR